MAVYIGDDRPLVGVNQPVVRLLELLIRVQIQALIERADCTPQLTSSIVIVVLPLIAHLCAASMTARAISRPLSPSKDLLRFSGFTSDVSTGKFSGRWAAQISLRISKSGKANLNVIILDKK